MSTKARSRLTGRRAGRNESGQGIVESVAGLVLIITVTTLGCLLVCNVGMVNYYKQKLSFITNHTAEALVGASAGQSLDQQAKQIAGQLIDTIGLPVQIDQVSATQNGGQVTVSLTVNCQLFQNGLSVLPLSMKLSDTGSAVVGLNNNKWDGWLIVREGTTLTDYCAPCKLAVPGPAPDITKTYPYP